MKIVKKANGNIVVLNTDGTVKQVIQQTGVQMLLEGNEIKLIQNGYPIGYINADDVTHTQLEPAAQVAFSGTNSALMTLLAEDFFVLERTIESDGFVETTVNITSAQILAMGTTPIELLASPGAGKYYDYVVFLEYTFNTTPIGFGLGGPDSIGVINNLAEYTGSFISNSATWAANAVYKLENTYATNSITNLGINEPILLTTLASLDPNAGDGTIKAKIKYKIATFG